MARCPCSCWTHCGVLEWIHIEIWRNPKSFHYTTYLTTRSSGYPGCRRCLSMRMRLPFMTGPQTPRSAILEPLRAGQTIKFGMVLECLLSSFWNILMFGMMWDTRELMSSFFILLVQDISYKKNPVLSSFSNFFVCFMFASYIFQ